MTRCVESIATAPRPSKNIRNGWLGLLFGPCCSGVLVYSLGSITSCGLKLLLVVVVVVLLLGSSFRGTAYLVAWEIGWRTDGRDACFPFCFFSSIYFPFFFLIVPLSSILFSDSPSEVVTRKIVNHRIDSIFPVCPTFRINSQVPKTDRPVISYQPIYSVQQLFSADRHNIFPHHRHRRRRRCCICRFALREKERERGFNCR